MKKSLFTLIIAFSSILMFQGCGKYKYIKLDSGLMIPPSEFYKALDNKAECCENYSGFDYEQLHLNTKITFYMDDNSPCYTFDSGKSYLKAFQIYGSSPYYVLIESYPSGHIFAPEVMVLDSKYKVIQKVPFQNFVYSSEQEKSLTRLRVRYENQFIIDQNDSKYIVIYTTSEAQKYGLKRDLKGFGFIIPIGNYNVPLFLGEHNMIHKNGPVGEVSILITNKSDSEKFAK